MPLLDHFNPPLNRTHPWRSFHAAWAAAMARLLNHEILPEGDYALPFAEREDSENDAVEVQVFADEGEPRLMAAVELVSPRNKDRSQSRQSIAVKCVGYLQQGSSVVVVDIVTTRRADVNAAILELLHVDARTALPTGLAAVSYRAVVLFIIIIIIHFLRRVQPFGDVRDQPLPQCLFLNLPLE